jgi:hypothetical protein
MWTLYFDKLIIHYTHTQSIQVQNKNPKAIFLPHSKIHLPLMKFYSCSNIYNVQSTKT